MFKGKTDNGIYAPSYYNDFKCIADRCRHSCCIDWEICIDRITYEKYKGIENIIKTVDMTDDGPCFLLRDDGRCPHLNENGLCTIILSHGEELLSDICKNHPRFYNYINSGRIEAGLGIVCEEACRLILENEKPFSLIKTEDIENENTDVTDGDFDPLPHRDKIISVIESGKISYDEKTEILKKEYDIPEIYTPDGWIERFLSLEILDPEWEKDLLSIKGKLFGKKSANTEKYGKYYERLLTYFVYRHISTADSIDAIRSRLAFAVLSVNVIRSLFEEDLWRGDDGEINGTPEKLIDFARRYSAEIEYSEENTAELIFEFEFGA